ncbi:hypothetical protein V3C99_014159 [Haemonchus contortus]
MTLYKQVVFDAGEIPGKQFFVAPMLLSPYCVVHAVTGLWIPKISIFRPTTSSAFGAAAWLPKKLDTILQDPTKSAKKRHVLLVNSTFRFDVREF